MQLKAQRDLYEDIVVAFRSKSLITLKSTLNADSAIFCSHSAAAIRKRHAISNKDGVLSSAHWWLGEKFSQFFPPLCALATPISVPGPVRWALEAPRCCCQAGFPTSCERQEGDCFKPETQSPVLQPLETKTQKKKKKKKNQHSYHTKAKGNKGKAEHICEQLTPI